MRSSLKSVAAWSMRSFRLPRLQMSLGSLRGRIPLNRFSVLESAKDLIISFNISAWHYWCQAQWFSIIIFGADFHRIPSDFSCVQMPSWVQARQFPVTKLIGHRIGCVSDKQENRMHANLWIRLTKHLDGIKLEFSRWRTLLIFIIKRDPLYQIEVSPFPCVDKSKVVWILQIHPRSDIWQVDLSVIQSRNLGFYET